eukprot:66234-Pelagomonas_calceolata.AAC.1
MKGNYAGHQKECLWGRHSSSAGIVVCAVEGRSFSSCDTRTHSWRALWIWVGRAREKESLIFMHGFARKEPLQLRCKGSRSRCYFLVHASKLGSIKCPIEVLESVGGYHANTFALCVTNASHAQCIDFWESKGR